LKAATKYLKLSIQPVSFLFTAFGGFLTKAAPPEDALSLFAVGLASFLSLLILLFLRTISKKILTGPYRTAWLCFAGVFIIAASYYGFRYANTFEILTFEYPPERPEARFTAGTDLLPTAKIFADRGLTSAQIVAKFGGPRYVQRVWTRESLERSRSRLRVEYVAFILSLATGIFSLSEALLYKPTTRRSVTRAQPKHWK
jgi:hypothetical protein